MKTTEPETPVPYVEFEYDTDYCGGNYSGVGQFVLVSLASINRYGFERAFELRTGLSRHFIVRYSPDELKDANGNYL
jgi:hypothetical protein